MSRWASVVKLSELFAGTLRLAPISASCSTATKKREAPLVRQNRYPARSTSSSQCGVGSGRPGGADALMTKTQGRLRARLKPWSISFSLPVPSSDMKWISLPDHATVSSHASSVRACTGRSVAPRKVRTASTTVSPDRSRRPSSAPNGPMATLRPRHPRSSKARVIDAAIGWLAPTSR